MFILGTCIFTVETTAREVATRVQSKALLESLLALESIVYMGIYADFGSINIILLGSLLLAKPFSPKISEAKLRPLLIIHLACRSSQIAQNPSRFVTRSSLKSRLWCYCTFSNGLGHLRSNFCVARVQLAIQEEVWPLCQSWTHEVI